MLLPAGSFSTSHMLGQLTLRAVSMSETHNTPCTLNRPCMCIDYKKDILIPAHRSILSVLPTQAPMSVCMLWCLPSLGCRNYS